MEEKLEKIIINIRPEELIGIVFDGQIGNQAEQARANFPYLSLGTIQQGKYEPFDNLPTGRVTFTYNDEQIKIRQYQHKKSTNNTIP